MKTWMKWVLGILSLPVVAAICLIAWVNLEVNHHLNQSYQVEPVKFSQHITGDPVIGKYIVTTRNACVECHGADLGGNMMIDDPAMGKVYAPNLTPASLKDWSDGEIARAIRHGVNKQGKGLVIMPAEEYINFSEQDMAHVIAYLRSLPAVDKPRQPLKLGPVASVLLATKKAPLISAEHLDHSKGFNPEIKEAVSAEYGHYVAQTACMGCHQPSLKGGPIAVGPPDWPPAADLTQANLGKWTEADFLKAMRSGVNPSGKKIQLPMPIKMTAKYKETELKALWKYLQTLKS